MRHRTTSLTNTASGPFPTLISQALGGLANQIKGEW
jgi:hypothetical protein